MKILTIITKKVKNNVAEVWKKFFNDRFNIEKVTPNGSAEFVEFIGVTIAELIAIRNKELTVKELYERLETDVTNYNRDSII